MTLTRRLKQFVKEVAQVASSDKEGVSVSYDECIVEYTDQIANDDFFSVVCYANYRGIKIPRALQSALKKEVGKKLKRGNVFFF